MQGRFNELEDKDASHSKELTESAIHQMSEGNIGYFSVYYDLKGPNLIVSLLQILRYPFC